MALASQGAEDRLVAYFMRDNCRDELVLEVDEFVMVNLNDPEYVR